MNRTYLKDFESAKIAYLPVGTIEWHGNHLPVETDALVAEKLCELVSHKRPGYVLPAVYLGTDKAGKGLRGMERHVGKKLPGEVYFIDPEFLKDMLNRLLANLDKFDKVFIITGHAGSKQIEVLNEIDKENDKAIFINPYSDIKIAVNHADEYETSLFWACYPEEEAKSRAIEIDKNDDYFQWLGFDPRSKASLQLGNELLATIINTIEGKL